MGCIVAQAGRQPAQARAFAPGQTADVPMRGPRPTCGAFHAIAPDQALVIYHLSDEQSAAGGCYAQHVLPALQPAVKLDLTHRLHTFFTATTRNGTPASAVIDLFGVGAEPNSVRYAQARLISE